MTLPTKETRRAEAMPVTENDRDQQVAAEDDDLMLQQLRERVRSDDVTVDAAGPRDAHNVDVMVDAAGPSAALAPKPRASPSSVRPGAWMGPPAKIFTPRTETGKFRTRLNPFANNVAFGEGSNLNERVREATAQELAIAPRTRSETMIVESHWEVFCELRGKEPWSPIPSGHEVRCFVQALADARRADGHSLYNYTTLKTRLVLLRVCIQKRNRNAWAARDAETCHDMERATDMFLQGPQTTNVGLNRRMLCMPIGVEENRLLVKTALTFTANMSPTVRMLSLRSALLQALLHTSGVRPSSAGVAVGYGYRQDPNFPSVADLMSAGNEDDEEGGETKPPIGGLRCGNVMLRLMEIPAGTDEEARVASPGEDGRFDLDRHSIFDASFFRKFGLGWELEQATSVGALMFVFFAARGLFALPWKEALQTGRFHIKQNLMNLPVFPKLSKEELVGITAASSRVSRLRQSYEATQRLLCHARGSNATATYPGSNNTDVNTANMWTGVGPIVSTADHNSAMALAFDQPAPRPGQDHMAAIYIDDEVLAVDGLSRADREKRIRLLRDREIKRMALEHEMAQTRARSTMTGLAGFAVALTCHCGHVSKNRKAAQAHNRTVHKVFQRGTAEASVESSKCPTCGKERGRNLARHMMTHEKKRARSHVCECGYGSFTAGDLAKHEKRCTGEMKARQRKLMQEAESPAVDDEEVGEADEAGPNA
ncbi:hypothetical protein BDZ88DRAFT_435959 [Geranomyces variabilis]|nr:hypothetical protein BDZ88DRAFT_435959 [Geranomyces variabilis]